MLRLLSQLWLGTFQAGMTLLGRATGSSLTGIIDGFDRWLTFLLPAFIGVKMIVEGLTNEDRDDPLHTLQCIPVIVVSIATSIHALAVGMSFAFLQLDILVAHNYRYRCLHSVIRGGDIGKPAEICSGEKTEIALGSFSSQSG